MIARALAKLEQVLPSRLQRRVEALNSATIAVQGTGPTVDAEVLTVIANACRDRETLRFDYVGHNGSETRRQVEPHRVVHMSRRWYLVGWDVDRQDSPEVTGHLRKLIGRFGRAISAPA
jgi:predicted DNA-binding transcriptional regulator YafY